MASGAGFLMGIALPLAARCIGRQKRWLDLIRCDPPAGQFSPVLGRVKGWVLAMLASLRVAPVPLRAFDLPCAPGDPECRSAPRNGPFSLTKEYQLPPSTPEAKGTPV